ncbi:MAG: hypothetical protein RL660_2111 [Bacteroidota bacterium]|jgi:hypothetical protein
MLLAIFFCIFYSLIGFWLIVKVPVIASSRLSNSVIRILYLLKLLGCYVHYYFNCTRFYGGDARFLFNETSSTLAQDTWQQALYRFFFDWSDFRWHEHFFSEHNSKTWTDIGRQLHFKFNTLCNVLTASTEAANVPLYCFVFFIGNIALYRAFSYFYADRKILILFSIFAIPSVWFWCSGMYKDGFVLSFIGLQLFYYNKSFTGNSRAWLWFWLFTILACAMRYNIAIAVLPCAMLLHLSYLLKRVAIRQVFGICITMYAIFLLGIGLVYPKIDVLKIVVTKQTEFHALDGTSALEKFPLEANPISFIQNLPSAINHVLVRPYPTEIKDVMYGITAVETYVLTTLIILLLFTIDRRRSNNALIQYCLIASSIMYIVIGYIVPFHGAFIRYRSEYLPLIFSALLCCTHLSKPLEEFVQRMNKHL